MSRNWSSLRKILEEDRLCPALRGRVQYFATTYHIFHSEFGRFAVRVDKQEWLHGSILEVWKHAPERSRGFRMDDSGVYCTGEFREAADIFVSDLSIDEAIIHENPIIRMFAVLDRRVGQRRLPESPPRWTISPNGCGASTGSGWMRRAAIPKGKAQADFACGVVAGVLRYMICGSDRRACTVIRSELHQ